MNFSSQTNPPAPVQSLLKTNTGSLLDSLDTETQARVLEQRFIRQPLVIAETQKLQLVQKTLQNSCLYDMRLGNFTVHTRTKGHGRQNIGDIAGYLNKYYFMRLCQYNWRAHNLVWLWFTGKIPKSPLEIDHINGIKSDNRLSNLRLVTRSANLRNKSIQSNNTSKYTGISPYRGGWRVRVTGFDRKEINIGFFYSKELAIKARQEYLNQNPELGYTTRHGT